MVRKIDKTWAIDISKETKSKGEVTNEKAINQSIEGILSTYFGERLFNLGFGSVLPTALFNTFTESQGEDLLTRLIETIEAYEDRITIQQDAARLYIKDNVMRLIIPYFLNRENITSVFDRKVII